MSELEYLNISLNSNESTNEITNEVEIFDKFKNVEIENREQNGKNDRKIANEFIDLDISCGSDVTIQPLNETVKVSENMTTGKCKYSSTNNSSIQSFQSQI